MRSRVELALRALALALFGWLLVQAFRPAPRLSERAEAAELGRALSRWSTVMHPARVHAHLDSATTPAGADWLAALARTGTGVSWDTPDTAAIAVTADPIADPAGGTRVLAAAPSGTAVVLADQWGVLDAVTASRGGARFIAGAAPRSVGVRAGAHAAWSVVRDSLSLGRVLVLAHAGWEGKFVAAALEERGWRVDLDLALSPRGDVTQGRALNPDTGTHSAVIVLDTTAASRAGALARFVAQGGGLVLSAAALASPELASLAGARVDTTIEAVEPYDTGFADPRRSLALSSLAPRAGAVTLEQRGARTAMVARRSGRGRVAAVGYQDTWRWRLAGSGDAPEAHRTWWASLVASVANARHHDLPGAGPRLEAPRAMLFDRLGQPSPPFAVAPPARALTPWIFGILLAALLAEWASRRLRGAA